MSSDTPGATVEAAAASDAGTAIAAAAVGAVSETPEAAVLVTDDDGIRRITLNRPSAANALRPADRDAVIAALSDADADPSVRVVVLAANGRHFCSGADVKALAGDRAAGGEKHVGDATRRIQNGAQRLVSAVLDCGKPVVAVVGGPAAGIGAHLAFAADLVVASEEATFLESFVRRGLVVDGGGAYLLPRRIGLQKAKELAFFGDALPAREALALGLVNRVVPAAELAKTADELATRLADAPTSAIALTKRLFNTSLDGDRAAAFAAEAMAQELQSHAHDSAEGVRSFVERRAPQFRGH
ncbi:enoyl-CoA hydratase/isomerase family protein [Cryptosporangium aurantiacum]|uniref:Enoyl-CoA hydratase n=1 Tax=Cryptosporangium aurantiacum TaxID=134849 RepID=A0A1M7PLF9_9ACTN|nr:enoyl-CoA hydratase-related protein [Cryptosporangium aurantiacum]SHN18098.1 Enoyl-CoA hydratase [Cryptosporangium aurantiacum]